MFVESEPSVTFAGPIGGLPRVQAGTDLARNPVLVVVWPACGAIRPISKSVHVHLAKGLEEIAQRLWPVELRERGRKLQLTGLRPKSWRFVGLMLCLGWALCCLSMVDLCWAQESPPVTLPKPLVNTHVAYPPGAVGDAKVLLELVVSQAGTVSRVRVLRGAEPFASQASEAADRWKFEPAKRGRTPVASRIRFEVKFSAPPKPRIDKVESTEASETPPGRRALQPEAPKRGAIEVVVVGEKPPPAMVTMTRAEVKELPGAFGDPFRAIEVLPGVTPMISGLPYFFVRGSPPGNVGYFLDGIRVPLLYHVAAGPSVVNPALIEKVDLYPGGYPARFGRFAGGIVSGETTEPRREFHGEASIRLLDTGGMVEAPIFDERGSITLGGRYSYTALALSLLAPEVELSYWDYQARAEYDFSSKDNLSLFSFGAFDFLGERQADGDVQTIVGTEFHRIETRWQHRANARTDLRLSAGFGVDRTRAGDGDDFSIVDRVVWLRTQISHRADKDVLLRGGADVASDSFSLEAEAIDPSDPEADKFIQTLFPERSDLVSGAWADMVWQPESWVTVTPGLRVDSYSSNGDAAWALSPRLAARFEVSDRLRLLHTFGVAHQPPSFVVPIPGLSISGLDEGLQRSLQSSAGVFVDLPEKFSVSFTFFQNAFFGMTDAFAASKSTGDDGEDDEEAFLNRSLGSSVGMEIMLRRSLAKRLGGFVSYTLSRSTRSIGREKFPHTFDRAHVLNAALAFNLGKNWRLGNRFTFYTGFPVFGAGLRGRSPERVPPFYRLDFRLAKRWRFLGHGSISFVVEAFNATLNKEIVSVDCDDGSCRQEEIGPVTIPSIGVEAVF